MIADKACYERGCACYDHWGGGGVEVVEKREWVGLTEDEVNLIFVESVQANHNDLELIKAIEAKLKEKNNAN